MSMRGIKCGLNELSKEDTVRQAAEQRRHNKVQEKGEGPRHKRLAKGYLGCFTAHNFESTNVGIHQSWHHMS